MTVKPKNSQIPTSLPRYTLTEIMSFLNKEGAKDLCIKKESHTIIVTEIYENDIDTAMWMLNKNYSTIASSHGSTVPYSVKVLKFLKAFVDIGALSIEFDKDNQAIVFTQTRHPMHLKMWWEVDGRFSHAIKYEDDTRHGLENLVAKKWNNVGDKLQVYAYKYDEHGNRTETRTPMGDIGRKKFQLVL